MLFIEIPPDTKQINVNIDNLVPFKNYPLEWFNMGQRSKDMFDIIREQGVRKPINIRPISNGKYEILNGHYRVAAAKELNIPTIPAWIHEGLTDEDALSYVSKLNPIGLLLQYGFNIHDDNYKDSAGYKKMQNNFAANGFLKTALDGYIERYLLSDFEKHSFYKSIYDMGDPSELDDAECEYEAVAREIVQIKKYEENIKKDKKEIRQLEKSKDPKKVKEAEEKRIKENDETNKLIERTIRQLKDYSRQLKKHLNIDLNLFDYSLLQNKRERAKILYFIYMLKREFPHNDILMLLSKPSMENIDNSFLGYETSNGKYVKEIKDKIEKEISPDLKREIEKTVSSVVKKWSDKLIMLYDVMNFLSNQKYDVSDLTDMLKIGFDNAYDAEISLDKLYLSSSPLEILYLKLIQHEYLGQMKDFSKIFNARADINYHIPDKYVEEMEKFELRKLDAKDFDAYFESKNVKKIAEYVYLNPETSPEERRKIRNSKNKVLKLLNFASYAKPTANVMENITELKIISCLQAIILDKAEKFYYTFANYEGTKGDRKGKKSANMALTESGQIFDIFKAYWLIRVKDRTYSNLGKSDLRKATNEVTKMCVGILEKILDCPTIGEMHSMHKCYYEWLAMVCELGKAKKDLSLNPIFN